MPDTNIPGSDIPSSLSSLSVRTMASDVESLKKSGGINPIPEIISAPPLIQNLEPSALEKQSANDPSLGSGFKWAWVLWLLGLGVFFFLGYFVLPKFFQ